MKLLILNIRSYNNDTFLVHVVFPSILGLLVQSIVVLDSLHKFVIVIIILEPKRPCVPAKKTTDQLHPPSEGREKKDTNLA